MEIAGRKCLDWEKILTPLKVVADDTYLITFSVNHSSLHTGAWKTVGNKITTKFLQSQALF